MKLRPCVCHLKALPEIKKSVKRCKTRAMADCKWWGLLFWTPNLTVFKVSAFGCWACDRVYEKRWSTFHAWDRDMNLSGRTLAKLSFLFFCFFVFLKAGKHHHTKCNHLKYKLRAGMTSYSISCLWAVPLFVLLHVSLNFPNPRTQDSTTYTCDVRS